MSNWIDRQLRERGVTPPQPSAFPQPSPQPVHQAPTHWQPSPPSPQYQQQQLISREQVSTHDITGMMAGAAQSMNRPTQQSGETENCPRCNSSQYFNRANLPNQEGGAPKQFSSITNTTVSPAPHCYECGFNNRFEQFADAHTEHKGSDDQYAQGARPNYGSSPAQIVFD